MNIVHARSYMKINAHLNKTQMWYMFYIVDKDINLFPNLKIFFSKINESVSLCFSGKRFQIFGPR